MKIACPRCGSMEVKDAVEGAPKPLNCINGHQFAFEEGLVSFSDAVAVSRAIGHPTRLRILLEFGRRPEMSANEVAKRIGQNIATARYHILALVEHSPSLIKRGRKVSNQGATEQKYELNRKAFA